MKKISIVFLFLLLLLSFSVFAACGGENPQQLSFEDLEITAENQTALAGSYEINYSINHFQTYKNLGVTVAVTVKDRDRKSVV